MVALWVTTMDNFNVMPIVAECMRASLYGYDQVTKKAYVSFTSCLQTFPYLYVINTGHDFAVLYVH